jgi:hypothetical protein
MSVCQNAICNTTVHQSITACSSGSAPRPPPALPPSPSAPATRAAPPSQSPTPPSSAQRQTVAASTRAVPPSARPGGGPRSHLRCSIPETSQRRAGRICRKPCGARALAVPATIGTRNLSDISRFWKYSRILEICPRKFLTENQDLQKSKFAAVCLCTYGDRSVSAGLAEDNRVACLGCDAMDTGRDVRLGGSGFPIAGKLDVCLVRTCDA